MPFEDTKILIRRSNSKKDR